MPNTKLFIQDNFNHNSRSNLYPALKNTKDGQIYGYINDKGTLVIQPKFEMAFDFNMYNTAIVKVKEGYGIISTNGQYIVQPIYDNINEYKDGRAVFALKNEMGILDENGQVIKTNQYNYIGDFSNERALVSIVDKNSIYKYGYIDTYGNEVIPPKFNNANNFNEDVALVTIKDKEFALINKNGTVINSYYYNIVTQFSDSLMAFAESFSGPYGYINKDGTVIIEPKYTIAEKFNDGVAVVSVSTNYNGPFGLINKKGEYIYQPIYSSIKYLEEERVALGLPIGDYEFANRSIYAIANINGNILTDFIYLVVGNYINGFAFASNNTNTFFIDKSGIQDKKLPTVKGSGQLLIKGKVIYADIDFSPFYLNRSGEIIYKANSIIPLNDKYSIVIEKYKPNINYLIYYPKITGIKNRLTERNVNIKLKEMSYFDANLSSGQIKNSTKEKLTPDSVLEYDYYGSFKILYFNNNTLCLDLNGYYYPLGAAHGLPTRKTPTINLITGKFYTLGDLFNGGVYWVGELNKIIENMIKNNPEYSYVYPDGFKGIKENQDFYIDEDNLYIYFPPYEIGPYAAGYITFKIPFESIKGMLNNVF